MSRADRTGIPAESSPLDALLDLLADKVVQRLRGAAGTDWVGQASSPLGRRRHCAAVQRRLATGEAGACIVGRDHRLSPEALSEELQAISRRKVAKAMPPTPNVVAELERELAQVGRRP